MDMDDTRRRVLLVVLVLVPVGLLALIAGARDLLGVASSSGSPAASPWS
jgi:hypothetical protein